MEDVSMRFRKATVLLLFSIVVAALSVAGPLQPPTAQAGSVSCSGSSTAPVKLNTMVASTATVRCSGSVPELDVKATLRAPNGSPYNAYKTCYNATSCSVAAASFFRTGTWSSSGYGQANTSGRLAIMWYGSWTGPSTTFQ